MYGYQTPMRFLTMSHFDWLMVSLYLLLFVVLMVKGKLPSVRSLHELFNALNSRGGNIVVLALFSIAFFRAALQFFYWSMDKIVDGKMSADNAILLAGLTFVTGTAFGGSFSSMLKSMTGENSQSRAQPRDGQPPDSTTVPKATDSVTSVPEVPKP